MKPQILGAIRRVLRGTVGDNSVYANLWQSDQTGLGGYNDKTSYFNPHTFIPLDTQTLQILSLGDYLSRKIVHAHCKEAFRRGYRVVYRGSNKQDLAKFATVNERLEDLGLRYRAYEAGYLGRLYGMGGILAVDSDNQLSKPLDKPRSVNRLLVLDRRSLMPRYGSFSAEFQPYRRFDDHASYDVYYDVNAGTLGSIHPSRIAMFGGLYTDALSRRSYFGGADCSVLQPVFEVLRSYNNKRASVDHAMQDASFRVLAIPGYHKLVASGFGGQFITRLQEMAKALWLGSTIPIDAGERLEYVQRTFSEWSDLREADRFDVAAAADAPVAVVFGDTPGGLAATGLGDLRHWHATVAAYQAHDLTPPILQIVRLVAQSFGCVDLKNWRIIWENLEHLTLKEHAELESLHIQSDIQRVDLGIDPAMLVRWRYVDGYNPEPPELTREDLAGLGL